MIKIRMMALVILVLAVFSLTSCVPYYAAPVVTPQAVESPDAVYLLGMAQARATAEAASVQRTQTLMQATLSAQAMQMTAQQAEFERGLTMTAAQQQAEQTQVAATQQVAVQATAWSLTQTPMAATQQAVQLVQEQRARQAAVESVLQPITQILGALLMLVTIVLVLVGFIRLWPHAIRLVQVLERRAATIISPDGQVITYIPADDRVNVVQPGQSFYPVMQVGENGGTGSGAAEVEMQNLQNSRSQTIALAHAMGRGRKLEHALRLAKPKQRPYRILQPGAPIPFRREALDAEWHNSEEEG